MQTKMDSLPANNPAMKETPTIKKFVCTFRVAYVRDVDESRQCAQEIEYVAHFDEFPDKIADLMINPGNWIRTFSSTTDDPQVGKHFRKYLGAKE